MSVTPLSFTLNNFLNFFVIDVVSVACGRLQKLFVSDNPHDEDLYHWINFLFVLKDYQV